MAEKVNGDILIQNCHRGKLQDVMTLIGEGKVDINHRNENGCTALHAAAAAGQLEVVEWLVRRPNIDVGAVDDADQSALFYAAFHGHLEVVQLLVEHGFSLDMPDKFGRLVHNAGAINGHLDVVTYLLDECSNPININAIDEYGGTCLHWAALRGRKEVVQYLCKKGIDVHLTSYDNRTALQLAKDKHKLKCVQFLKSWIEQLQQLIGAAEEGNISEVQRIIGEVNQDFPLRYLKDKDGRNALHWAAGSGHLDTVKVLADHFDVLTDVDKYGRNALHWAALGGHRTCALWLVAKSKGTTLVHTLTLTNKSPSRCAFEAGHAALAAKLQALEEGHDEVLPEDTTVIESKRSPPESPKDTAVGTGRMVDAVNEWLKDMELEEYTDNFARDGFDTLRGVATVNESDLIDMNVKKGHRRVVLSGIEDLKQRIAISDDAARIADAEIDRVPTLSSLPPLNKTPQILSAKTTGMDGTTTENICNDK